MNTAFSQQAATFQLFPTSIQNGEDAIALLLFFTTTRITPTFYTPIIAPMYRHTASVPIVGVATAPDFFGPRRKVCIYEEICHKKE